MGNNFNGAWKLSWWSEEEIMSKQNVCIIIKKKKNGFQSLLTSRKIFQSHLDNFEDVTTACEHS